MKRIVGLAHAKGDFGLNKLFMLWVLTVGHADR